MTDNKPKRKPVGRPKKYSGKRPTWTIRMEESVGGHVKEMAASTGRSISETCEYLIGQGLHSSSRIHDLAERIKFLEMTRNLMEERLSTYEEERLNALEDAADQTDEDIGSKSNLVAVIEDAVERAVKRALEQKD
jgi:hypothetical protein